MMNSMTWLALALVLLQGASVTTPIRVGDFARQLTAQDVMALEQIATAGGAKSSPWLLEGPFNHIGNSIRMYLPAESQTAQVRRGRTIDLFRRRGETLWRPMQTMTQYAQVVEVGRDFNSISGDRDIHRPFTVSGTFSDEELLSLVTFIRGSPGQVRGSWPISSLSGDASSVMLWLVEPSGSGRLQRVLVVRQGSDWKVTDAITGIA